MRIAGSVPYWALSDYRPGGFNHAGHRAVFMPGCFADWLSLAATGRVSVRLLAEHTFGRQLATTADGSLKVWETERFLCWSADLASAPPVPVRFCSFGAGNVRTRLHTFASGQTIQVIERAHLLEVSLVSLPAFESKAKAWVIS